MDSSRTISFYAEGMCVPYFSLSRALWIPRVMTWDADTGFFERVDGPEGFKDYLMALEASRFLVRWRAE